MHRCYLLFRCFLVQNFQQLLSVKLTKSCVNRFYSFVNVKVIFLKHPAHQILLPHTRTDSTDHNFPKSFTKLVTGTATIFTLIKQREDFTTGKRNISRPFSKHDHSSAIADHVKKLVTTSNGTILTFWRRARLTTIVRLKRPCLFKSYSQH